MIRATFLSLLAVSATPGLADVPNVATDIAPVHSLVSQVMSGVGEPSLIVRPGASPHGYAMRPSEARALQEADLVVWMGEALTPWMEKPLSSLASSTRQLELLDTEGTSILSYRDLMHDEEDEHDGHKDEAEGDEHDDHAEDTHAGEDEDHHDHDGADPHAWLDPENARAWLLLISGALSEIDPANADAYRANAEAARARLAELAIGIEDALQPMKGKPFIAFHDAYQYFERRFGLSLTGTVSLGDATNPGPSRLAHLRDVVSDRGVACAFSEPQFNVGLIEAAIEGSPVRIFVLDPLGADLEPGADLYPQILRNMSDAFGACAARY